MEKSKLVADLLVDMEYQGGQSPRSCFVVFSSREKHVEIVIDCIENVFQSSGQFQVVRLDQHLKSGDSQYSELTELIATCCFAVVVLDGFRPNVLFEYGILRGLNKPCIVLLEEAATVDILSFFDKPQDLPCNPLIDMDKHFSDVKDRFYLKYNRNKPKQIRTLLQAEHQKLTGQIETEFLHSMFPHQDVIKTELKAHLSMIVDVFTTNKDDQKSDKHTSIDLAHSHVSRLAKEHKVVLPPRYFSILARTYAKIDSVDKAVTTIDEGLSGTKDDASLLSDKAQILHRSGRIEEAMQALDAAIKIRPKAEFLWHNKGLTFEALDKINDAMRCYKKAISLDSSCAKLHFHYGITLYQKKDFPSAHKEFKKALKLRPKDKVFLLWEARVLDCLGKADQARPIIERLIEADQTNSDAWYVLGNLEEDDTVALSHFRKAVELKPNHGGALCSSAACLSNLGQLNEALEIFSEMNNKCPRHKLCPTLISNVATTLAKFDRAEEGLAMSEKILTKDPEDLGALEAKACSLARLGKHSSALEIYAKLIATNPQRSELFYNQACTYALAKAPDEAVKSLGAAINLDPKWLKTAKSDSDFTYLRRTKVYRTAILEVYSSADDRSISNKKAPKSKITPPTRSAKTTK